MTTSESSQLTYSPREYLSISTLLSFARCKRRYFYNKVGLESRVPKTAAIYGQAMHKAIPLAITEDIDAAVAAFDSVWDSELDNDTRNIDRATSSLRHYQFTHKDGKSLFKFREPPTGGPKVDEQVSDLEIPFAIDIGLKVPLAGRMDAWVNHRDTGEVWGWELKTTSRLNAQFFEAFEMNPQILAYALVLQTMTGEDVKGVMVEGVHVHKTKVDNMIQPFPTQQHHLERMLVWLQQTGQALLDCEEQYLEKGDEDEAFPQDFSGCTAYPLFYMAGWRCEYADLCRVGSWKSLSDLYDVKPEFSIFTDLTVKGA